MTEKKKSEKKASFNNLSVTRYTRKAWTKTYGKGSEFSWLIEHKPYSCGDFISEVLSSISESGQIDMNEVKMISFMPLDDDFFKWLRQSGHSNGSVERAEYTLDDEIRVSKLASHRLLTDYHLMEIPVLIAGHQPGDRNEIVIDVPSEIWALLEKYLENFFPAERIYIPGRIISQEDLYFKQEYLFNMAYSHFERGINVNVDIFESLIFDEGVSLFELGIPVILKGDFDGQAVIPAAIYDAHASDLINAPDNLAFTREGLMEKGLSDDIPTLLESEFYKKLLNWLLESNLFGEQAQILVNQELLSVYDLPDYAKALRDLLKE